MRQILLGLILFTVLLPVHARADDAALRAALLAQIQHLQAEVERLQEIVAERLASQVLYTRTFQPYTDPVQYHIVDSSLQRGTRAPVIPTHQTLFEQLQATVGAAVVDTHLKEFHVEHVQVAGLDNYIEGSVEWLEEDNAWVFTIRRDGTRPLSDEERELFTELFLHEYAHILMHHHDSFAGQFTERFWSESTYALSERVEQAFTNDGYDSLDDAYEGHTEQFVSGYAMLSPDEDLAETFVRFVEEEIPTSNLVVDHKVRAFYANYDLLVVRAALRSNLGLGW